MLDLGGVLNLSTIVFVGDEDENTDGFGAMQRTVGLQTTWNDPSNLVITQAGGTNYPSMIADINDGGTVYARYIHWRADQDFKVAEILCYEKKRIDASDIVGTVPSYIQPMNGHILTSGCEVFTSDVLINIGSNKVIFRVIGLNQEGDRNYDNWAVTYLVKSGATQTIMP